MSAHSAKRTPSPASTRARLPLLAVLLATALSSGCRQDMHNQPKMIPQRSTTFFADGRSARPQVQGTVARSQSVEDSYYRTGMVDGKEGDGMPFPVTMDVVARGQERYNVYCTPCHSRVGNGLGMIVQRGYHLAGNFHTERLRQAPLGHFFNVITNGYGAMPEYSAELTPQDRWAVVSYIRALQLSQNAANADVSPGHAVSTLGDLTVREGLPQSFAEPWRAPSKTPVLPRAAAPAGTASITSAEPPSPSSTSPTAKPGSIPPASKTAEMTSSASSKLPTAEGTKPTQPKSPSPEDVAAGQQVYLRNCLVCHQATRAGMPPVIPSLIGVVGRLGAAHVRSTVMEGVPTGKPPMPAFPNLSSEDIDKLIAFLAAGK